MKSKILIAAAMTFSIAGFSQKDEIKAADKAFKTGDFEAAKTALEGASSLIDGADAKLKAQYYFIQGNAYNEISSKSGDVEGYKKAIEAYNKLLAVEEAGKIKYTVEAKKSLAAISGKIINSAIKDNENKNFEAAAEKLYMGYTLSKKDTVYLYYAASSAVNGRYYEKALTYYNELKDLNYDGSELKYTAVNIETGEVENLGGKQQRDLMVKSKKYKDPKDEKTPSRKGEIIKNIALIYTQLGQDDKALQAYADARVSDPKDVNLILNQANLYFKQGNKDKFKSLMAEATQIAPDNPDLHYNIGVINGEQGNVKEARESYKKAIEIDPGYVNAQLNLSTTFVNEGNGLVDQMNALGNSRADIAKYDELKQQKDNLFAQGAQVLEDALKLNPGNQGILSQLKNIYGALGDNENFMKYKKLLGE